MTGPGYETGAMPVGIAGMAVYLPERVETGGRIAEKTGLPPGIVKEKYGIDKKYIAGDGSHACGMAVKAALLLLEKLDAGEIDVVIYCGSPHKEYQVWSCAPMIKNELGLTRAYTFEIMNMSAGFSTAVKVARDMLAADFSINNILLAGGSRESEIIDPANRRTYFMLNFSDGGAAMLLRKNHHENLILGSSLYTDGTFCNYIKVPAGGTVKPASSETIAAGGHYVDVFHYQEMKEKLRQCSVNNFIRVVKDAMARSGYRGASPDFIVLLHTKPSVHRAVLEGLGMEERQSFYLNNFGHMSSLDIVVALNECAKQGRIRKGDIVAAASAGTGYTWAANVIRWG